MLVLLFLKYRVQTFEDHVELKMLQIIYSTKRSVQSEGTYHLGGEFNLKQNKTIQPKVFPQQLNKMCKKAKIQHT